MMDENAILVLQWDDVRHRPERDEIKPSTQLEIRHGTSLQKCVTKFKHDPDAAEITEGGSAIHLWINDRDAIGHGGFRFVMIDHDDIRSAGAKFSDFRA